MRLLAFSLLALAACLAGKAAQTVQPKQPTVGDADPTMKSGGGGGGVDACKTADRADLMVVDWTPEMRGDIEVAMKEGLALVSYDCASVKLVPACSLGGEYGYIGTTRREKKIEMNSKDEVAANLPVGGLSWLSDLGGKFGRESALLAHLVMVGKRSSAKKRADRGELTGDCASATHFVRATTVGAFLVATGSKADIAASAKILGKGASGSSSSSTKIEAQDGDLDACTKSTTDGKVPPDQCGAVLRIELEPIGGEPKQDEVRIAGCPPGFFEADGACRGPEAPHQCSSDSADCDKQCKAGHGGSCATLALMYREGMGVKKDWAKAAKLAQQACDKDVLPGCRIAAAAKLGGQGVDKDPKGALALFDKACLGGDGKACVELGVAKLADKKLAGDAQYSFRRACYGGGEFDGCAWLGTLYVEGKGGMSASPKVGAKFYEKGCKEGSARACVGLAELYSKGGKGIDKDAAKAKELYAKACNAGDDKACKQK